MRKFLFLLICTNSIYAQCWKTVVARNSYHCVGIQTDGTLWTWGFNNEGQLGDATLVNKEVPTQIGAGTNWESVSNHYRNSFAIKSTGTLWGWGDNSDGQLGIGNFVDKLIPTQIGTANTWKSVSNGIDYVLAIRDNGSLWAWGSNANGQIGNGTTVAELTPIRIGNDFDWVKVEAGPASFGIKSNGTLWFWGNNLSGTGTASSSTPIQVGNDTWLDISATYRHVIGLKTNGTIWSWGNNDSGCLGRGNASNLPSNYIATQIGTASNWKAIAAGTDHSMAIKTNGTLWSWGDNTFGQYGNNSTTASFVPVQIGTLTNWRDISLGYSFVTASKTTNDRLWVWGRDNQDALGNDTNGDSLIPIGIGTCTTLDNENFEILNNSFKIYPNPVQNELIIDNLLNLEIQELNITDILGKIILKQNSNFKKINLQDLKYGIYVLSILSNDNKVFQHKIIKK